MTRGRERQRELKRRRKRKKEVLREKNTSQKKPGPASKKPKRAASPKA